MEKLCPKCNEMKYITAFEIKEKKVFLFLNHWYIDYSECMDCKYPHRWDEIRKDFNELLWE